MDTTDTQPQTQTQPKSNQPPQVHPQAQPTPQQQQHHPHPHHPLPHRPPAPHAQAAQPTQPHPQHIQQQHQTPIHQQSTHPTQIHAQSTAYAMQPQYGFQPYTPRHANFAQQYAPTVPYNQSTISPYTYPQVSTQYGTPPWPTSTYQAAPVATPSSQELSSTAQSTPSRSLLAKRAVTKAVMKDPVTNKEVSWDAVASDGSKSSNAKSSPTGTTSTQSPATEKKPNPITSANTNNVTNSVTISSSRTNTSSPPSISNELLRKVSEDTDLDKRQVPATTVTKTTKTTTTRATIIAPTTKPETTTKPTPIVTPTAIKTPEKVETKVNNINGNHQPFKEKQDRDKKEENEKEEEKDKEGAKEKDIVKEKEVEVVNEESSGDGDTPSKESTVDKDDSTEAKSETEDKVNLHYEPWQYNPKSNRTGKKKYDRQFLIDVCVKLCKLSVFDEDKPDNSMDNYVFPQDVDMFKPNFARGNMPHMASRQNDASRRMNNQNYMNRTSASQDRSRKIIAPSPILTQEVELKTVANPWRPAKEVKQEVPPEVIDVEKLKKNFRSILNKLTPNNFDNLAKSVTDLNIDTETKLGEVIDIVFAKALSEPGYCVLYGQMCSHLKKITAGTTNFGNTLLKRCQHQFQSDIYSGLNLEEREKKISDETDAEAKKHMQEELYEEKYRCRMRGLGLIKFIGELYKIDMLNDAIMFDCMLRLLNDVSEESLECLCDLLVTIGEKLDRSSQKRVKEEKKAQKAPAKVGNAYQGGKSLANVVAAGNVQPSTVPPSATTLDDIFNNLHRIRKNKDLDISLRIRFKLLDVCELREKENWHSKKDNNPKKLDEIREAHMEKLENEKNRLNQAMGPRRTQDGRRHLGHSGGSSSQISSLGNESGYNRGGANMHGSASSHAICDHSLDDKTKQNSSESYENHRHNLALLKTLKPGFKETESNSQEPVSLRPNRALLPSRPAGK